MTVLKENAMICADEFSVKISEERAACHRVNKGIQEVVSTGDTGKVCGADFGRCYRLFRVRRVERVLW